MNTPSLRPPSDISFKERMLIPIFLLAIGLILFFIWQNAGHLLIIFTAILVGAFFDSCTQGLSKILPVRRSIRLSIVLGIFAILSVPALIRSVLSLPAQVRSLIRIMDSQLDKLHTYFVELGFDFLGTSEIRDISQLIPDPSVLFGHFQLALGSATSLVASFVVVLCLGAFFAADPARYRAGFLCLVPPIRRPRVSDILSEMGGAIRGWFLGQVIRVIVLTLVLWSIFYFFDMQGSFLLAFQAGLSNFIPYIGPFIAAIPVGLVAMPQGLENLALIMIIYFVVQNLEGYVLAPLVHRGTVQISPAWTLAGVLVLGSAFGVIGMALATPLLALARIALLRFYVEDYLGDTPNFGR